MLFRNRRLVRAVSCLLLLEMVGSVVTPAISWAAMGPGQPEFTSYESPGSTDMVNLTTGDMTYNIPVLDVPGPERSFSLPLTYRAGIRLEQEASWVGLGWSLNAGAIARSLNNYPDDVSEEIYTSYYKKKVVSGWTGGIPGVLDLAWDSETGHSGTADLIGLASLGWENGKVNSGDLVGVKYSKGQGVSVDPVRMAFAAVSIASIGSASTVTAAKGTAAKAMAIGGEVGLQAGQSAAIGTALSAVGRSGGSGGGSNQAIVRTQKKFLHTNYWIFFNDNKQESMYGSLYFQEMSKNVSPEDKHANGYDRGPIIYDNEVTDPTIPNPAYKRALVYNYYRDYGVDQHLEHEVGADLHQHVEATEPDYRVVSLRPLSIAHDDFSVMGNGVSGSIRPQLLEVGSVAFPKKISQEHDKYNVVPFLDDYKLSFRYENSASNSYEYHKYTAPTGEKVTGIDNRLTSYPQHPQYGEVPSLVLRDKRLKSLFTAKPASGEALTASTSTAPARKGIINRYNATAGVRERGLVQGKHVEWYSNQDILKDIYTTTDGNGEKFLEFYKPQARMMRKLGIVGYSEPDERGFQYPLYDSLEVGISNDAFRVTLPGKGIGAFRVTAEDGTTYHYSLPVYHYSTYSESREKTTDNPGVSSSRMGDNGKFIYATTWLLTAITSSDYVDRNQLGVVDDQDWGGWVKLDYGRFSTAYKWRQPYVGDSYLEQDMSTGSTTGSFSEGTKQTYYLNSIRTRSHTALFVKSVRHDGRGHFQAGASNLGVDEHAPSSSLRLNEIILLTNEDADKLRTPNGINPVTGSSALTTNTADNALMHDAESLRNGDTYRNVLDTYDLEADPSIRAYINQRALKRIVFNYSYRLCQGTPNSFPNAASPPPMDVASAGVGRSGKLTLESLSTFGPLNTKLIPDFKFSYANNPIYGRGKWDGFGMYNSAATDINTGHAITANHQTASQDGAAWSLTEILNPLGGRTQITYERDQYSTVSEHGAKSVYVENTTSSNTLVVKNFSGNLTNYIRSGDTITVHGSARYERECNINTVEFPKYTHRACDVPFDYKRVVLSNVTATSITIRPGDWPEPMCPLDPNDDCGTPYSKGARLQVLLPETTEGGDIRVASVTTLDENGTAYQVRYRYQAPARPSQATSTGVISKLPEYVDRVKGLPLYDWYDYPATSVMYSTVTVLRGQFRNNSDADHDQREEYSFYTPVSRMVHVAQVQNGNDGENFGKRQTGLGFVSTTIKQRSNQITVDMGKLGQPRAIRKYNRRGELEMTSSFGYAHTLPNAEGIPGQGRFTEGIMTNELLNEVDYRVNRTTKEYIPTTVASTTTVANGMQVTSHSTLYDFLTGQVLETTARNSLGDTYVTKTVPAYTQPGHATMGPKGENPANRNMLSQVAGRYVYKQSSPTERRLLAASVQTWNANWTTYRVYQNGEYIDESAAKPVWRQQDSYVWNGARLNGDGTYAGFTDFNWNQPTPAGQATGWLKVGEVLRYDHYSKPLEVVDLNSQYAATKSSTRTAQKLASAANARYVEMAYSGAEDEESVYSNGSSTATIHFSGEVRKGGERDTVHHTGLYSSRIQAGEKTFTYQAPVSSSTGIRPGRQYRLSAWVHRSDETANGGRLYATLNGNSLGEASIHSPTTKKAGNWYVLNLYVTVPTGASGQFVAGCRNIGTAPVLFDDFRFHPLQGPMTAYSYDPHTGSVTYVLDNENLYTRYFYDAAGKATHVYKETLDRLNDVSATAKLVRSSSYNYARMREPNWVRTGLVECEPSPVGNYSTGFRRYRRRDMNPQSVTYNQEDWEMGEATTDCKSCAGFGARLDYMGNCEQPVKEPGSCVTVANGDGTYTHTMRYIYRDGTTIPYSSTDSNSTCEVEAYRTTKAKVQKQGRIKEKPAN